MSYGMTDEIHAHREAAQKLRLALKTLLMAIDAAKECGCIDHLDAWPDSEVYFDMPINDARKALEETKEYAK